MAKLTHGYPGSPNEMHSLDAAWARCEMANPDFEIAELRKRGDGWLATAWALDERATGYLCDAEGPTPAAALNALAENLRETQS